MKLRDILIRERAECNGVDVLLVSGCAVRHSASDNPIAAISSPGDDTNRGGTNASRAILDARLRIRRYARAIQPVSVRFRSGKKASFREVLRVGLGVSSPERYANSHSERRILSEAWGMADLLDKFFCLQISY